MEKKKSIGAFWKKISKGLTEYYSGNIEIDGKKINLVMFINGQKKEDKHPDLQVYLSEPRKKEAEVPVINQEEAF